MAKDLQDSQNFRQRRNFGLKIFLWRLRPHKNRIEMHKMLSGN